MKKIVFAAAITLIANTAATAETYRLIHAIGNEEREAARDLTKEECEARKRELKAVAEALGTGGSITCLPDSFF